MGITDELYFLLCKQLTNNPGELSTSLGWRLMTLFLHYLHPSPDTFPYLNHFITISLENQWGKLKVVGSKDSANEVDGKKVPPPIPNPDIKTQLGFTFKNNYKSSLLRVIRKFWKNF